MTSSIVTANTNGLGEIIKVAHEQQYADHYDYVYFKPHNGVRIRTINRRHTSRQKGKDQTNWQGGSWSDWQEILDYSITSFTNDEAPGCIFLGADHVSHRYESSTWGSTDYEYYTDVDILGEADVFNVEVVGNDECVDSRYFICHNDTYIYRKTANSHIYAEMVGFSSNYWEAISEGTLPEYFSYRGFYPISTNSIPSYYSINTTALYQGTEFNQKSTIAYNDGESPIRHVLLYVDRALAIFKSAIDTDDISESESETAKANVKMFVRSTYLKDENSSPRWDGEYTPAAALALPNKKTHFKFYPCKKFYDWYHGDLASNNEMIRHDSGTIPNELSWVECFHINGERISRYYNYVKLIDLSQSTGESIGSYITARSAFIRFTDYWHTSIGNNGVGINKSGSLNQLNPKGNLIVYPVFKPYAEVDLVVFAEEKGKERKAFSKNTYEFFLKDLRALYGDKAFPAFPTYRKHYYINADDVFATNQKIFDKYSMTVTPHRTEMFCCHGGRYEYDKNTPGTGQSNIWVSDDRSIDETWLKNLHETCKYWWWGGDNLSLAIYIESCYGGGMQQGVQRARLDNCICKNANNLVPNINDVFAIVAAPATDLGWGNVYGTLTLPILKKVKQASSTTEHKEIYNLFNNLVQSTRSKVFRKIKDFYEKNYNFMLSLVPEDEQPMWIETKQLILDNLNTQDVSFFSMDDYEPNDSNYRVSDNYFFPDLKQYRINDGFIGYIKKEVFGYQNIVKSEFFLRQEGPYADDLYKLDTMTENLAKEILQEWQNATSSILKILPKLSITAPVCSMKGRYVDSDVPFLTSPNEGYYLWLASDAELKTLCNEAVS